MQNNYPFNLSHPENIIPGSALPAPGRSREDILNLIMRCSDKITWEEAYQFLEDYSFALKRLFSGTLSTIQFSDDEQMSSAELPGTDAVTTGNPVLEAVYNVVYNNRTVMSGSIVQVRGSHLLFNQADRKQGIFLVDEYGMATRINSLVRHTSDGIVFMVPGGLASGQYRFEMRTMNRHSVELRVSTLPGRLSVVI